MSEPYPEYNVLDRMDSWDDYTRQIVEDRMATVPQLTFFTNEEAATLEAAVARILPQQKENPIPIVPFIDEKLAKNRTDGTQYEDMPTMQELWRIFIKALNKEARNGYKKSFTKLDDEAQDKVLAVLESGKSSSPAWSRMPSKKSFQQVVGVMAMFYYSHPSAWSEVGWGGPKYPERYVRITCGVKDPEEPGRVGDVRG